MPSEIKQTPRNKARAERQLASQISGSGLTKPEFIAGAQEYGFSYQAKGAETCSDYTSANAPKTFAWFLEIIESLTSSQINEATSFTCTVPGGLATEPPVPPPTTFQEIPHNIDSVPVPNPTPEPTPIHNQEILPEEPTGDKQPSLDVPDDIATLPTVPPTEEPTSSDLPHEIVTPPTDSPATTPEPSNNQTILPTEDPVTVPDTQNDTEISPDGNLSDTAADPNKLQESFYKTTPFIVATVVGAVGVLALTVGGCLWKKRMSIATHQALDGEAAICTNLEGLFRSLAGSRLSQPTLPAEPPWLPYDLQPKEEIFGTHLEAFTDPRYATKDVQGFIEIDLDA